MSTLRKFLFWVKGQKTQRVNTEGKPSRGSFENVQTVAESICLGNLAIRMNDRLEWDNEYLKVSNLPEANTYL